MKKNQLVVLAFVLGSILIVALIGIAIFGTALALRPTVQLPAATSAPSNLTPQPTYTPLPTYTPFPTNMVSNTPITPALTVAPTQPPAAPQPASQQPETCGLIFPAYSAGNLNSAYDVRVDCWTDSTGSHLRGWQFRLPVARAAHSVAIQLPKGNYSFNGVLCRLYLDEQKNGRGSSNPMVAGMGNNLPFTVSVDVAYALVECDGGAPSGLDYWSR